MRWRCCSHRCSVLKQALMFTVIETVTFTSQLVVFPICFVEFSLNWAKVHLRFRVWLVSLGKGGNRSPCRRSFCSSVLWSLSPPTGAAYQRHAFDLVLTLVFIYFPKAKSWLKSAVSFLLWNSPVTVWERWEEAAGKNEPILINYRCL